MSRSPGGAAAATFESGSFAEATLRSERVRIVGMLCILGLVSIVAFARIVRPVPIAPLQGWGLLAIMAAFGVYEAWMCARVTRRLAERRDLPRLAWRANVVIEAMLPLAAIVFTLVFTDIDPDVVLLSPAVGFMLTLMMLSTLRLDASLAALGGGVSTGGYVVIVLGVLLATPAATAPTHEAILYYVPSIVLVLVVGTIAASFVASQIRRHVLAALREAELEREKQRLERDLAVARTIQQRLLPARRPRLEGYEIAGFSEPADETGGDYYDWQPLGAHRVLVSLADVTGHGIGPALVTAGCRAYVRALTDHGTDPFSLVTRVNALLHADLEGERFVTFVLVDLDVAAHRARLLAAGHAPTLLVTAEGEVRLVAAQGVPLGVLSEPAFEDTIEVELAPGDVLALVSDGLHEARNVAGEQFTAERLAEVMRDVRERSAAEIAAEMDGAVRAFAGGSPQLDDMTAVVIKRDAGDAG